MTRRGVTLGVVLAVMVSASLGLAATAGARSAAPASPHRATAITLVEGGTYSGQVAAIAEPCVLQFIFFNCTLQHPSATIYWGDGTASAGTLTPGFCFTVPVCVWTASGTHIYAIAGSYTINVSYFDPGQNFSASATNTAQVSDAALSAGSGPTISGTEGSSYPAVGSFTDADTSTSSASDFSATINWGDGSTSAGSVTGSGGNFQVSGSHAYDSGDYPITISVSDAGGSTTTITGSASIADAALSAGSIGITATEGPFSGTVATFSDADLLASPSEFTATIQWGDGATSVGTVTGSGGSFRVSGTHTYEEGTFSPLTVAVADVGGNSVALSGTAQIADAPLSGTPQALSAFAGVPFSGVVADFTDASPIGTAADFTATIDWGDGTTSSGTVTPAPAGGFEVSGSHTFAAPETLPVTVHVIDAGSATATIASSVQVGSPPAPVTSITPAAPNGSNGWSRGPVRVVVSASGLGVSVAATRCVVDPASAPASFDALPASCPFTGAGATVSGDGVHQLYAASISSRGDKETPKQQTIRIDATPPSLTCEPTPTFVLGSSHGAVGATVRDATSGPASSTASTPVALSSPGLYSATITGYDNAGNPGTARCAYRVFGHLNNPMDWGLAPGAHYSTVAVLVAYDVPIGSQIEVFCTHAGCPFHSRSMRVTASTRCTGKHCTHKVRPHSVNVNLAPMFGRRHLGVGSQLMIVVSQPYMIGKVLMLTVRSDRQPASTFSCMAPGSHVPGQGC